MSLSHPRPRNTKTLSPRRRQMARIRGSASLRVPAYLALALLPIVWTQTARGLSIPSREPPAATDSPTQTSAGVAPAPAEPVVPASAAVMLQSPDDQPTPTQFDPIGAGTQLSGPSQASADADAPTHSTNLNAASESDAGDANTVHDGPTAVTVIVTEPEAADTAQQAASAAQSTFALDASPAKDVAAAVITEIAAPRETVAAVQAPAATPADVAKPKRAIRKVKSLNLALAQTALTASSTRGLGTLEHTVATGQADSALSPQRHVTTPAHTVQLSEGRGIGQTADLGRSSPMSGAAPNVFADGHHVVAASCEAREYLDNPYFTTDPFGKTRDVKCP